MIRGSRGFADKKKPCSLCPDEAEQKRQNAEEKKEKKISIQSTKRHPKEDESMCKHHSEMVPDAAGLKNLKEFSLRSDCSKFHLKSEGFEH